jgi:hypothetical protein
MTPFIIFASRLDSLYHVSYYKNPETELYTDVATSKIIAATVDGIVFSDPGFHGYFSAGHADF